jgi:hypothetical protein
LSTWPYRAFVLFNMSWCGMLVGALMVLVSQKREEADKAAGSSSSSASV